MLDRTIAIFARVEDDSSVHLTHKGSCCRETSRASADNKHVEESLGCHLRGLETGAMFLGYCQIELNNGIVEKQSRKGGARSTQDSRVIQVGYHDLLLILSVNANGDALSASQHLRALSYAYSPVLDEQP